MWMEASVAVQCPEITQANFAELESKGIVVDKDTQFKGSLLIGCPVNLNWNEIEVKLENGRTTSFKRRICTYCITKKSDKTLLSKIFLYKDLDSNKSEIQDKEKPADKT